MIITSSESSITYDELATLKQLAQTEAKEQGPEVTSSQLADQLNISSQTVSRRLQSLEEAGLIDRKAKPHGQRISIKGRGKEVLMQEYQEYVELMGEKDDVELTGTVVDGMGEGKEYLSLRGYAEQFRNRLGYTPFPGTLNVELDDDDAAERSQLEDIEPTHIEGWEDSGRTYGPAHCYPARLVTETGNTYKRSHVIVPERTDHDETILEIIAEDKLKDTLDLNEEDEVTIHVLH